MSRCQTEETWDHMHSIKFNWLILLKNITWRVCNLGEALQNRSTLDELWNTHSNLQVECMIKDQIEWHNIENSFHFRAKYILLLLMINEVTGLELGFEELANLIRVK